MSLGISLLGVNEVREFGRISNEENGSVIHYPIPVTLIGSELDSETTGVTRSIRGAGFTSDCGKPSSRSDLLANRLEQSIVGDVT